MVYFSASRRAFIPAAWKDDGTYTKKTWPADALLLTEDEIGAFWKKTPPAGHELGSVDGRPVWAPMPPPAPLAAEHARALRQMSYRTESDPLKLEAEYDAILGGTEPDYSAWLEKVAEVKARYPLPE